MRVWDKRRAPREGSDFRIGAIELDVHRLLLLKIEGTSIAMGIYAEYVSRKHLPMKTRRLIDFLVDAAAARAHRDATLPEFETD